MLAVLVICTIETSNWLADPVAYSVFNVIFEVVSAYGCVGISVGVSNEAYSFSGNWHTASKLVLCAVMIRGRHRGLPVALDRAVRLPGEGNAPGRRRGPPHQAEHDGEPESKHRCLDGVSKLQARQRQREQAFAIGERNYE